VIYHTSIQDVSGPTSASEGDIQWSREGKAVISCAQGLATFVMVELGLKGQDLP